MDRFFSLIVGIIQLLGRLPVQDNGPIVAIWGDCIHIVSVDLILVTESDVRSCL